MDLKGEKVITFDSGKDHYQDEHITKKAHFNDLFGKKFTPIAMKCTQEQFDAIKPKLKGFNFRHIGDFNIYKYLINNSGGNENTINNVTDYVKSQYNRKVYEEWNEELFLKNCGIEDETLEQQLEKAKAEVARLEKEIENNKIKVGDWGKFWDTKGDFVIGKFERNIFGIYMVSGKTFLNCEKITNPQLIELLEKEMK